jgi:hypothetical protein
MIELTSHSSWTFMLKQHNAYVSKERDLSQRHAIYQKSVALAQLTLNQLQSNREGACFVHIVKISPHIIFERINPPLLSANAISSHQWM